MDGHDKSSFELAGSVALIVAFTVLIILMLRKKSILDEAVITRL